MHSFAPFEIRSRKERGKKNTWEQTTHSEKEIKEEARKQKPAELLGTSAKRGGGKNAKKKKSEFDK